MNLRVARAKVGAGGRTRAGISVVVEIVLALRFAHERRLTSRKFCSSAKSSSRIRYDQRHHSARCASGNKLRKTRTSAEFYKKLLSRVSNLPGVQSSGAAWWIPLSGSEIGFTFNIEEHPVAPGQQSIAQLNVVTPDYFQGNACSNSKRSRIHGARRSTCTARSLLYPRVSQNNFSRARIQLANGSFPWIGRSGGKPPVREIVGVVGDANALDQLATAPKPQFISRIEQFGIPVDVDCCANANSTRNCGRTTSLDTVAGY